MLVSRHRRMTHTQDINVTSFMDVLTVLLFFLIRMITVSSNHMNLPQNIILPESPLEAVPKEAAVLMISSTGIQTEEKILVSFKNGKVQTKDLDADGRTISNVLEFLKKELAKRNKLMADNVAAATPGTLTIQADKELPFAILKYVFHTATKAGHTDYQFIVKSKT